MIFATQKCPACDELFDRRPALARFDNRTKICPRCGMADAIMPLWRMRPTNLMEFIVFLKSDRLQEILNQIDHKIERISIIECGWPDGVPEKERGDKGGKSEEKTSG